MTRVLVTGGLGVIGSLYVRHLLEHGVGASVLDVGADARHSWTRDRLGNQVQFYRCRLEKVERARLAEILSEHDSVLHAAAHTGIPHSEADPDDDWASNVDATRNLLEAMRTMPKPPPTVVLSSVKPYRVLSNDHVVLTEDTVLEPDEPYAASKAAQSMLCMAYARTYGLPVVTFRCSNLYGAAPCHGARHGWLTWFCVRAALGEALEVQGSGDQSRDMLYSSDVNAAVDLAFAKVFGLRGKVFNLGGGCLNVTSVNGAVKLLGEMCPGTRVTRAPARRNDDERVVVDTSFFKQEAGWVAKVGVEEGMLRIVTWARENADELRRVYGLGRGA